MSAKDIASALDSASNLATLVIPAGGPAGIIAGVVSVALKAASAIAAAGGDPVIEIARILSSLPEVAKVHGRWDNLIDREFPSSPPVGRQKSVPPPASSSPDSGGVYDED